MDVKKYLEEYKIQTAGKLVSHISELKRNTKPNLKLISSLASYLPIMHDNEILEDSFKENRRENCKKVESWFCNTSDEERVKRYIYLDKKGIKQNQTEEPNLKVRFFKKDIDTGGILFSEDKLFSTYEEVQKYGEYNNYTEWHKLEHQIENNNGIKETNGKLYYELSWEFIEEMAKRMANNKSNKYPLFNWKKNIDVEDLKQAINRHHIEVMKGNYKDGDELLGHVVSYACNSMMLWEQLNKS